MNIKRDNVYKAAAGVVVLVLVVGIAAYISGRNNAGSGALPANPSIAGTLEAVAQNSVTIKLQNGSQKTFTVSPDTQVVTQVKAGEVGKTLAQIGAGPTVLVQPHAAGSSAADRIFVLPTQQTAVAQNAAGPTAIVNGTLVSTSADGIVINAPTEPSLHVTVTKDTVVTSNVLAGQAGMSLTNAQPGTYLQVVGVAGKNGPTATSIQLLTPLP